MIGVAQVIGRKPILRSFFSRGPFSCAMASSAPKGISEETAANAVEAPMAERNLRRSPSWGNSAFITAVCTTRLFSVSTSLAAVAMSCWVLRCMLTATATATATGDGAVGVERIVQCHGALPVIGLSK